MQDGYLTTLPLSSSKGGAEHHGQLHVLISAEIREHKLAAQEAQVIPVTGMTIFFFYPLQKAFGGVT